MTLKVYDILGKEIVTIVDQNQRSGNYEVKWNASEFPSGVYIYELRANRFVQAKKLQLLK